MNVEYPMLFQLRNGRMNRATHCGVCEFSAQEGCCYLPFWMMQNLMIGEGEMIAVKNVSLPKAKFVKFRPQSVDFLEISNPRAVLEKTLRSYTCLTSGDQICIQYLNKKLYLEVVEVKPGNAASIVETDCEVDFDEPVGYVPPPKPSSATPTPSSGTSTPILTPREVQKARAADEKAQQEEESKKFQAFSGRAMRVDGRPASTTPSPSPTPTSASPAPVSSSSQSAASAAGAAALARQSLVGNKYSTKKVSASAFHGKASTLSGSK
jgi:ubiquitin fusion degradation protein 1